MRLFYVMFVYSCTGTHQAEQDQSVSLVTPHEVSLTLRTMCEVFIK